MREGDRKEFDAPQALRNEVQRAVWIGRDRLRELIRTRQASQNALAREQRKKELRLAEEENILLITSPTRLVTRFLTLLAAVSLVAASLLPDSAHDGSADWLTYFLLSLGLIGIFTLNFQKHRAEYLFTNFRLLLYQKQLFKKENWNSYIYTDISRIHFKRNLICYSLTLKWRNQFICFRGIHPEALVTIKKILMASPESRASFSS